MEVVRPERCGDEPAIAAVVEAAFGQPDEARLVAALRGSGAMTCDGSLVAIEPVGRIVGHVVFSRVALEVDGVPQPAAALAPLAVLPSHQRRGIGHRLVRAGLDRLREQGYAVVLVLGSVAYYGRFGFSAALAVPLDSPYAGPHFQALELVPAALRGVTRGQVVYPAAFTEVS